MAGRCGNDRVHVAGGVTSGSRNAREQGGKTTAIARGNGHIGLDRQSRPIGQEVHLVEHGENRCAGFRKAVRHGGSGHCRIDQPDHEISGAGALAVALASVNIFGGFLVTSRMLAMYKKKGK